jgi:hypothetical protein
MRQLLLSFGVLAIGLLLISACGQNTGDHPVGVTGGGDGYGGGVGALSADDSGPVEEDLVGQWQSYEDSENYTILRFDSDGSYHMSGQSDGYDVEDSGDYVVSGSSVTIYPDGGGSYTMYYWVSGNTLNLNGEIYQSY